MELNIPSSPSMENMSRNSSPSELSVEMVRATGDDGGAIVTDFGLALILCEITEASSEICSPATEYEKSEAEEKMLSCAMWEAMPLRALSGTVKMNGG